MVEDVGTVAKGISDFGMMAVTAAFFLVISGLLWVACFKWFKSIIDNMIKGNSQMVNDLLEETRKQNDMLNDISEGLKPETQLRVKHITSVYFDLAVENVCRIIKKIREENHIADKEATLSKIRTLTLNLHEDRESKLDCFSYRGKRLSSYINPEWVKWVAEIIEHEIYNEAVNNGRTYTNVKAVYDRIKLDFYHRMNRE